MAPRYCLGIVGIVLLMVSPALAEPAPEELLSANTILYLRYDGIETHRKAFELTATGELMRGELGEFIDYLTNISRETIGPAVVKDQLLEGKPAHRLQDVRKGFGHLPEALRYLGRHGFVMGLDIVGILPPKPQLTIIFPGASDAKNREAVFAGLRLMAALAEVPITESKFEGRTFYQWDEKSAPVTIGWWQEGAHIIMSVGADKPARTIELADKKRRSLLENSHYKELVAFKDYETAARGFIDLEKIIKPLQLLGKAGGLLAQFGLEDARALEVLDHLGLENIQSLSFQLGFEGRHLRSTVSLRVPGKRPALLRLLSTGQPIELDQLPPLPPDATGVYAFNLDVAEVFDLVMRLSAGFGPDSDEAKRAQRDALQDLNRRLGVDVRADVLGTLGSKMVVYNAPSEGAMSLGFGLVAEVKNARRLQSALDALMKSLPLVLGENVVVKKHQVAGTDMYTVHVPQDGFFMVPSFTLHRDRLVLALFPQTVRGYLLRASGKMSSWKPTPLVNEALLAARKGKGRVLSINVSDPRPTINLLCSIGPILGGLADSSSPGSFDVKRIPHAQALTEPLYPNVSLLTDDGDTFRLESRSSLTMPLFDISGMDSYFTALIGYQILRLGN